MRKPKFRVYVKENGLYSRVGMRPATQLLRYDEGGEVFYKMDSGVECSDFLEDVELMQRTGLVDKNNKSIYEGDVVLATKNRDDGSEAEYLVVIKDIRKIPKELYFGSYEGYREVIGNIREHPHLLDSTNTND